MKLQSCAFERLGTRELSASLPFATVLKLRPHALH
jgi:hypothetical protein